MTLYKGYVPLIFQLCVFHVLVIVSHACDSYFLHKIGIQISLDDTLQRICSTHFLIICDSRARECFMYMKYKPVKGPGGTRGLLLAVGLPNIDRTV